MAREWVIWDARAAAERPELVAAVAEFASLDTAAGAAASAWLREEALRNDGSTRTRLLLDGQRVEAYFALCAGQVRLARAEVESLDLPPHRLLLPAIVLAWIARHEHSSVRGLEVMQIAFAIAQRVSREIGAVAFVLDPRDDAVGRLWREPPYAFRPSSGGSDRLWIPLSGEG